MKHLKLKCKRRNVSDKKKERLVDLVDSIANTTAVHRKTNMLQYVKSVIDTQSLFNLTVYCNLCCAL